MCERTHLEDRPEAAGAAPQRLFFAVWPDDRLREALGHIGREALTAPGRLVPPENLHLTLVFLGSTSSEQRHCAEQVAGEVRGSPFTLCFDRLGVWPRPRVLWLAPSQAPAALFDLVTELTDRLTTCGFRPPARPYRAHLTLARNVASGAVHSPERALSWRVSEYQLVASQTLPEGARYRRLGCWPLIA